jgi:hypothetical protein
VVQQQQCVAVQAVHSPQACEPSSPAFSQSMICVCAMSRGVRADVPYNNSNEQQQTVAVSHRTNLCYCVHDSSCVLATRRFDEILKLCCVVPHHTAVLASLLASRVILRMLSHTTACGVPSCRFERTPAAYPALHK